MLGMDSELFYFLFYFCILFLCIKVNETNFLKVFLCVPRLAFLRTFAKIFMKQKENDTFSAAICLRLNHNLPVLSCQDNITLNGPHHSESIKWKTR